MTFMHQDMGHTYFMSESFVFCVMAGWIAEVLFMLFYAYTAV